MKKKGINTVLILAVIGLYSVVAYRYFNHGTTAIAATDAPMIKDVQMLAQPLQANFSLTNLSRDPFFSGGQAPRKPVSHSVSTMPKKQISRPELPVNAKPSTNLKFKGIVKNLSNSRTVILVSFNGNAVRMSQGDVHDGYKLEKIFKDSCLMRFGKEKLMVKR
jgi:type II secretory pathway component PulC